MLSIAVLLTLARCGWLGLVFLGLADAQNHLVKTPGLRNFTGARPSPGSLCLGGDILSRFAFLRVLDANNPFFHDVPKLILSM